jgi:YfiH family protein
MEVWRCLQEHLQLKSLGHPPEGDLKILNKNKINLKKCYYNHMIIKNDCYAIYFGNSKDNISKKLDCVPQETSLKEHHKFISIIDHFVLQDLAFLNQTHSIDGMVIDQEIPAFNKDGDYLITDKKNIGLGVMTADCLPIIFYDSKKHVAAAAHAGWRGTVAGVAIKTTKTMQVKYGTAMEDLQIFFGPSAKKCCYIVDEPFLKNIKEDALSVIERKNNGALCFDLPGLNTLQLKKAGYKNKINTDYNFCTICDDRFFSYRRQAEQAGRQMSIIALR